MPFFRHVSGVKGVKMRSSIWEARFFYKYWIRACEQLGIEGVDLYGGTRHTTTTRKLHGAMGIRETQRKRQAITTNKAFLKATVSIRTTSRMKWR
jgi:hypothetical protein